MSDSAADWKCMLFASVDIAGSTAFKAQNPQSKGVHWVTMFEGFFDQFPLTLLDAANNCRTDSSMAFDGLPNRNWEVWKYLGDEILFCVQVDCRTEVCMHLHALRAALSTYKVELKKRSPSLGLKASAWIGNFPFPNKEVCVPQQNDAQEPMNVRDFLGSGIDLGFRVSRFADARRITITAGLAMAIVDLRQREGNDRRLTRDLHIGFSGREALRGVMGGRPYPLFWLDRGDGNQTTEDRLSNVKSIPDTPDVKTFLEEFFRGEPDRVRPFFIADADEDWQAVPEPLREQWADVSSFDAEREYIQGNEPTDVETGPAGTVPDLPASSSLPDE